MDEKSYLDEYRRDLRNKGLQKPINRVCAVSSIKPEYQSSVMNLNIKAQLWDPSGRIYIMTRADKLLMMFNERIMLLGKVKGYENVVTGVILIYPSMVFLALEVPSDCTLAMNTVMAENMGSEDSYVLPPKLISEAHGTHRMYDKVTSVILSIPGPMKMDLDRMRAEWMLSFKHIMKKVYKMSEVMSSAGIASRLQDGVSQLRSAAVEASQTRSPRDISMQSTPSRFTDGSNWSPTGFGSNSSDADQSDANFNDNNESHMNQCVGKKSKNKESVFNQNYGVDAHGESFNAELSTIHEDGSLDLAERERKREQFLARRITHDMAILDQEMQRAGVQEDANFNARSLGPSRSRLLGHKASEMEPINVKTKRMMLNFGDPALKFIPPQRDLVLVLNCDKFWPLSDSVKLHSRKWNLSAEDGNGWPHDSDDQRLPLDVLKDKSTRSKLTLAVRQDSQEL